MKRELILKVLTEAKKRYMDSCDYGMCFSITRVLNKNGIYPVDCIAEYIPKYNRKFCNAYYSEYMYWWPYGDRDSRIKAFNKLIDYYSQPSLKERIINKIKQYGRKCIFWK